MKKRKVILVMDWLDAYAGSEQIVKYLHQVYSFDKVYTLINIMPKENFERIFGQNTNIKVKTSTLQFFGKHFRIALPLFPFFLKQLKIKEENVLIISVTHSVVKGVEYPKNSTHISYLVARNLKYVWEEKHLYFKGIRKVGLFIAKPLQRFDVKMASKPTKIISVSHFVSKWAKEKYDRDILTLNPPVKIEDFDFQEKKKEYYISVGRLEPYKRYDLLIETFNKNGKRLIIIGDGSLKKQLEKQANKNIEFKGYLFAEAYKSLLKNAKAFVFCGKEDFGITLLEAQICGTPVITYKAGGALDSVLENTTGMFFTQQTSKSLNETITKFEKINFDTKKIREHAIQFSVEKFKKKFHKISKEIMN
mgnify:CR=1 FL=1